MNKAELVNKIATDAGCSATGAQQVLEATLDAIQNALANGEGVRLVGFGTFKAERREAYTGRNPKNGQAVNVPARNVVKFSVGKSLKEAVR